MQEARSRRVLRGRSGAQRPNHGIPHAPDPAADIRSGVYRRTSRAFASPLTYALLLSLRMPRQQPLPDPASALRWSGGQPGKAIGQRLPDHDEKHAAADGHPRSGMPPA